MEQMLRVSALSPRVYPAKPMQTVEEAVSLLEQHRDSDLILLPAMWLTPPSLDSLLQNRGIMEQARKALARLANRTADFAGSIVTSMQMMVGGKSKEQLILLSGGEVIEVQDAESGTPIYRCGTLTVGVVSGNSQKLSGFLSENPVDVVVNLRYQSVIAGTPARELALCRSLSELYHCGVVVLNGGYGDTSSPLFYRSFGGMFCVGESYAEELNGENMALVSDFDPDITAAMATAWDQELPHTAKTNTIRKISRSPYLPERDHNCYTYLAELFDMQVCSLATRVSNIHAKTMVLGVSGGLDSTLAILVAAETAKRLGYSSESVVGITMPGFGTSGRTYQNAVRLIKALGAEFHEVSIVPCVEQHLKDIGHDISNRNVTYENAQARERTQILMDIANDKGGLVVGTGDLSEEALGWCTFGGDHLANYNVNVCLTKSMIRAMVAQLSEGYPATVRDCLNDILDTPVSPELLPPDENGAISQKTEEILGPYELHDFFLYYLVKYGFSPKKIYDYSVAAFGEELDPEFIRSKLELFLRRFAMGQFKRSCTPDSAVLTELSLSGAVFSFPSDLDLSDLIGQINK